MWLCSDLHTHFRKSAKWKYDLNIAMLFSYYTFKNGGKREQQSPSKITKIVKPALQDGVQIDLGGQSCWENS